ncbi:hypothetical protein [Enhygromyxa salina]|nr:hypothetical protein [Enhygromyxa salina]
MIYGVFNTRTQAETAIQALETEAGLDGVNALVHEEYLRDEDVQMGGTNALRGAIFGAVVVSVVAALIGGVLLIPGADLSVGWTEYIFMTVAGTIMGVTAGAVAGASEPRKELAALAARLSEGKVLVTMDADDIPPALVVDLFAKNGAVEVKAA